MAPRGWPRAMAPPLTLTGGVDLEVADHLEGDVAKASLISQRSMSPAVMPAWASAFLEAGVGAVSMMIGSAPAVAIARMRARGFSPCALHVLGGGQQHGGGAVDDAAGVAGGVDVVDRAGLRVAREGDLVERLAVEAEGVAPRADEGGLERGEAPRRWCWRGDTRPRRGPARRSTGR